MSARTSRAVLSPVLAVLALVLAAGPPDIARAADPGPVKYYVVQISYQGQPEFLYEIAQRFLGTGNRYTEIFALNKGRTEPDGKTVTSPSETRPGWILQLPPDATGDGVQTGPLPAGGAAPSADTAPPANAAPLTRAPVPPAPRHGGVPVLLIVLIAAGVLAAAGTAFWLVRTLRRRAVVTPQSAPAGDLTASWTVDRALRTLSTACAGAGRPLPELYAVTLQAREVTLRLSAPDEDPPAPWRADEHGRTWSAALAALQSAPVDPALADPYPRLVTAGVSDGGRVLLELSQARGVIGLDGDPRAARAVAELWTSELARNPWSQGVRVLRAGFRTEAEGVTSAGSLRELLADVGDLRTGVLLLAAAPSGREIAELAALLGTPGSDWSVVIVGASEQARWRFTVAADGRLDTGFLGLAIHTGTPEPALVS